MTSTVTSSLTDLTLSLDRFKTFTDRVTETTDTVIASFLPNKLFFSLFVGERIGANEQANVALVMLPLVPISKPHAIIMQRQKKNNNKKNSRLPSATFLTIVLIPYFIFNLVPTSCCFSFSASTSASSVVFFLLFNSINYSNNIHKRRIIFNSKSLSQQSTLSFPSLVQLLLPKNNDFLMIQTFLSRLLMIPAATSIVDATTLSNAAATDQEASTSSTTTTTTTKTKTSTHSETANTDRENAECRASASAAATASAAAPPEEEFVVVEGVSLPTMRTLNQIQLYKNGHGVRSITFFGMDIKIYVAAMYSSMPILSEEQALALRSHTGSHSHSNTTHPPSFTENHHRHHHPYPLEQHHNSSHIHVATSSQLPTASPTAMSTTAPTSFGTYGRTNTTYAETGSHSVPHSHNCTHLHHDALPIVQLDFTFLRYVNRNKVISAWTQQLDHSVSHKYDGYESDRDKFIEAASQQPIENGGTQSVVLVNDETLIIDQGRHKASIKGHNFQRSFLSMWFGEKAVAHDLKLGLLQGHQKR